MINIDNIKSKKNNTTIADTPQSILYCMCFEKYAHFWYVCQVNRHGVDKKRDIAKISAMPCYYYILLGLIPMYISVSTLSAILS